MSHGTALILVCIDDHDVMTCRPFEGTPKQFRKVAETALAMDVGVSSLTLLRLRYRGELRPISAVVMRISRTTPARVEPTIPEKTDAMEARR